MEKYYQLGTHTEAEWDELNAELTSVGNIKQSVPSRQIECVDDQLHSPTRGTYLLTDALLYTLNNPNPYSTATDDYFGWSVAISGDHAIVGAYREDDAAGTDSGKAYIFNATTGAQVHTLDNPNAVSPSTNDYFGYSVTISGDRAIVGAYLEGDAGGANSGKAYIFGLA